MFNPMKNIGLVAIFIFAFNTFVNAQEARRTSDISDFSEVELNSSLDLRIRIEDHYSIEITGDRDRVDSVELDRRGDELRISNNRGGFGWFGLRKSSGPLFVEITMPYLEEITINASGDVEVIGLDNEEVSLNVRGSGDLYVTGKSDNVEIELHGSGDIEMDEIRGDHVDIEIHGSGNVEFNEGTCDSITIEIEGSGDVNARNLRCLTAEVDIEGSGNTRIYASESVIFDGEGSGRLDVFGNPKEVIDEAAKRNSKIRIR